MINWQPISTAPLDGTDVFVYDGYDIWKAYYYDSDNDWYPSLVDNLWVSPDNHAFIPRRPLFHEPTHWLPISDLLKPLGHL